MRIVILGAAGRDFHDFNLLWREDPSARVVAFTAAQIPHIENRRYPASLAGPLYPDGIPIVPEDRLESLIADEGVDQVAFAYSDVSHAHVMTLAQRCQALGAGFLLPAPSATMLRCRLPVIAVSAVRTGCGKSPLSRWLGRELRARGRRVAVIRHPMPYGDPERQRVQRFACAADLDAADCTAEEREEFEPHLEAGNLVFAGVDYAQVLAAAEREADIVVWDGGNNDFPFVRPDLHIVVVDAWRPEQVRGWHPGEAVLRSADLVVVGKVDSAPAESVALAVAGAREVNPRAPVLLGRSPVTLDDAHRVRGARVLVVEDGPTLTHGGMPFGAGTIAARAAGAAEIVDPRPFAPPALAQVLSRYPALGPVLPALGYGRADLRLLAQAIAAVPADIVVAGTPIDVGRLLAEFAPPGGRMPPVVRARYAFAEAEAGALAARIDAFLATLPVE
jgi:predicted GTPase